MTFLNTVEDSEDDKENLFNNKISKVVKLCQELDKKQEVLISDNRPIMVCKNTMNKSKKCVFCKCFDCHMNEVLQKEKDGKKREITVEMTIK